MLQKSQDTLIMEEQIKISYDNIIDKLKQLEKNFTDYYSNPLQPAEFNKFLRELTTDITKFEGIPQNDKIIDLYDKKKEYTNKLIRKLRSDYPDSYFEEFIIYLKMFNKMNNLKHFYMIQFISLFLLQKNLKNAIDSQIKVEPKEEEYYKKLKSIIENQDFLSRVDISQLLLENNIDKDSEFFLDIKQSLIDIYDEAQIKFTENYGEGVTWEDKSKTLKRLYTKIDNITKNIETNTFNNNEKFRNIILQIFTKDQNKNEVISHLIISILKHLQQISIEYSKYPHELTNSKELTEITKDIVEKRGIPWTQEYHVERGAFVHEKRRELPYPNFNEVQVINIAKIIYINFILEKYIDYYLNLIIIIENICNEKGGYLV